MLKYVLMIVLCIIELLSFIGAKMFMGDKQKSIRFGITSIITLGLIIFTGFFYNPSKEAKVEENPKVVEGSDKSTGEEATNEAVKSEESDASLKSIDIAGVKIEPKFSASVYFYKATVDNKTEVVSIKAVPNSDKAICVIKTNNAVVEQNNKQPLKVGDNEFDIVVISPDNTCQPYRLTINRKADEESSTTYDNGTSNPQVGIPNTGGTSSGNSINTQENPDETQVDVYM